MIDVAFIILSYSYDSYRLRGFFIWVIGASILGILLNLYGLLNSDFPKFFYAFTVLSMVLLLLTLSLNFLLMYLTNSGKDVISNSAKEKNFKKLLTLICLFSSFGGILINFILFIVYMPCKFKKSSSDMLLFFLLDTWVALGCYYYIIGKLINYEMQSIVQVIKENERIENDKDVDSEIEHYFNKDEKNVNVIVSNDNNNNKTNDNLKDNNNNANKNKVNNINIFPSVRSVGSADIIIQ